MRLLWNNLVDDYDSPTVSSEQASFPASNVRHIHLSVLWRTLPTLVEDQYYKIDAGAGETITATCAAIIGRTPDYKHNLGSGATIKIQAHPTDSWGTPDLDQTFTWDEDIMIVFFSSTEKRYWRFYIDDPGNSNGYLQIPRLFLGTYYELDIASGAKSFQKEFTEELINTAVISLSPSRQMYVDEGEIYRKYTLNFPYWNSTAKATIDTIIKAVGKTKPILTVLDEDNQDKLPPLYCMISEDLSFDHIHNFIYRSSLILEEVA